MRQRRESILNLLARSPWWVGLSLAVLVYVLSVYVLPNVTLSSPILSGVPAAAARLGGGSRLGLHVSALLHRCDQLGEFRPVD